MICFKTLQNYGFSKIGNLEACNEEEVQKTVNCILEMIQQRQRDIEYRKEVVDTIAKLECDNKMQVDRIERFKNENKQLSKEIGRINNLLSMVEKKHKSNRDKLQSDRDELTRQMHKFSQKNIQYQHEIRKKEIEVNKLKDQVLQVLA